MNNIISTLLVALTFMLTEGCSQNGNSNTENKKNMEDKKYSIMETFDRKPIYGVNFSNLNSTCQFEISVNDMPVIKFLNQRGGTNSYIPINTEIIKSGKQVLYVKIFPAVMKDKITVGYKENTPFELSITVGEQGDDGILTNEKTIYELPFIPLPEEGLPYWETEIEFEAEVPYNLVGWSQSKNLTNVDNIEQKVLEKFKELQTILKEKNTKELLKNSEKKNSEIYTSLYFTSKQIKDREEFMAIEDEETVTSLDGAVLKFYAENRIVTLENPMDGKSALRTIIKDESGNGNDETITYPVYFHMSKSSNELEIIR